ncbi:hypothetical protein BH09PAT2_BH09PAT2_04060 [soil metagenome]
MERGTYFDNKLEKRYQHAYEIMQKLPAECRPEMDYLISALTQQARLYDILTNPGNAYLLHGLLDQSEDKPHQTPFIVDPEFNLVISLQGKQVKTLIPILSCTRMALKDLICESGAAEDEAVRYSSDGTFIRQAIQYADQEQTWTYGPNQTPSGEYLAAALYLFDNEPMKDEFDLHDLYGL